MRGSKKRVGEKKMFAKNREPSKKRVAVDCPESLEERLPFPSSGEKGDF